MRKRIVVDIDGVLAEWNRPFRGLLMSYGADMQDFHEPDRWNWFEHYGAQREHVEQASDYCKATPEWLRTLPAHKDFTVAARLKLVDLCSKHDVTFVTMRGNGRNETRDWLEWHLPYEKVNVILAKDKPLVLLGMAPDVVIDDSHDILAACVGRLKGLLLLVNRAYNQGNWEGLTRVESTMAALVAAEEG